MGDYLHCEHIQDVNLRVLRHEAETPMRGHDTDGRCCRMAMLGARISTAQPESAAGEEGEAS